MRIRFRMVLAGVMLLLCLAGCGKAEKYYEMGLASFEVQDYENALLYFSQAIDENPEKAEYYIEQGYTYVALERYEEARGVFKNKCLFKSDFIHQISGLLKVVFFFTRETDNNIC